jgi:hypothetical protein
MSDSKEIVRYKWEYSNFLEFVRQKKVSRAVLYAKSLGIERKTLVHWMSQPELRDALADSLDEIIDGMKTAGAKDWRMYRELYTMLGLDDVKLLDVTTDGEKIQAATIVDLGNLNATDQPETESTSTDDQG